MINNKLEQDIKQLILEQKWDELKKIMEESFYNKPTDKNLEEVPLNRGKILTMLATAQLKATNQINRGHAQFLEELAEELKTIERQKDDAIKNLQAKKMKKNIEEI